ncbi:MAG: alpha/beta hydrolase [Ilumatobacteraceae bacterium]
MIASPSSKPTPIVVLVHGAWHGAWCWAALQAELDSRGIASVAVDLPGHGVSTEPLGDLVGDAAHLDAVIATIDAPIVLVGHSYGGAVITEASATSAVAAKVVHLVYLTAYVPDVGESVMGMARSMPPATTALSEAMVMADDHETFTIDPASAHATFYGRCDPITTPANIARLCPQPVATFAQPLTGAGWSSIPSTYVRCTLDEAIHISHQDLMSAHCTNVETLETDHSPFASMPIQTAEIIARLTRDISL